LRLPETVPFFSLQDLMIGLHPHHLKTGPQYRYVVDTDQLA